MPKAKKFHITISRIIEKEFSYIDPFIDRPDLNPQNLPLEAKFALKYRWNIEDEHFMVGTDFLYLLRNDEFSIDALKFSYLIDFGIKDLKDLFHARSENDFDIDLNLETTLVSIALSTGRGILFEKSKGTVFRNFIIPPISTKDCLLSRTLKSVSAEKAEVSSDKKLDSK